MKRQRIVLGGLIAAIVSTLIAVPALAYRIESLGETPNKNDIVLGPGKEEIVLDPGQKTVRRLVVTNRTGQEQEFKVEVEDIAGSVDLESPIKFLGGETGPYSLKNFVKPEIDNFILQHGDRITLAISIEIPENMEPGGLYGAVLVRTVPWNERRDVIGEIAQGNIEIVQRLANIYYVRVRGEAEESGNIVEFSSGRKFYGQPPVDFRMLYENTGRVHLAPKGKVMVKNIIGTDVGEMKIDSFFVLPGAMAQKHLKLEKDFMFGYYSATLELDHGYDGNVEELKVSFWVLPWKIVLAILLVLLILIIAAKSFINWFNKNFERKKKA